MFDVLLDGGGDLMILDGDIVLTESVSQAIAIRLRWFLGEWRFNTSYGVPYYESIFVKGYDLRTIERLFTEQILLVDKVKNVDAIKVDVSNVTRKLYVSYKVTLKSGEILEEEVKMHE